MTSIEWTDATWNPVRGCSRVSRGCERCYAEGTARRFAGPGQPYEGLVRLDAKGKPKAQWNGEVRFVPEKLAEPLSWRKPRRVFVNSMSDLFHEGLAFEQIAAVFGVMASAQRHTFQVLTKRPERAAAFFTWLTGQGEEVEAWVNEPPPSGSALPSACAILASAHLTIDGDHWRSAMRAPWPLPNVWLGVSVEDQATADERIPALLTLPAAVRWVSYEPALGPADFGAWIGAHHDACDCDRCFGVAQNRIDWIVVGGESGPKARTFDIAWARSTVSACRAAGVPCFFKQAGSNPTLNGEPVRLRDRKGGDLAELPEDLRVRQWPEVRRG